MGSPTKKRYPNLVRGKALIHVHGFMSSDRSDAVVILGELSPQMNTIAEDPPVHPAKAIDLLKQLCQSHKPGLIIGTSMGGTYTEILAGYGRILVNLASQMGLAMYDRGLTGEQSLHNPYKGGETKVIVTRSLISEHKYITGQRFADVMPEEQRWVYGLFDDEGPLVHTFSLFRGHYPWATRFHGAHRVTGRVAFHYLIPMTHQIDDQQGGHERPVVYIDCATLHDSYDKTALSMHKAYKVLVEWYQIYVVAAAPTNNHVYTGRVQAWVEEYPSTPTYSRVIFTSQLQLPYGGYFITPEAQDGFIGACLARGSDEFKTWKELIVCFNRLGEQ